MKRVFLLIVVPALLVAMGFAQTPPASGNTDQLTIQGCLGGTEGNYTVAEDNTGKTFRITTSSADLKAYAGQEVKLTGRKASTGENSLAVTEVNMISEHCTAAAAAPAAPASAPADNASTPPAAAAPGATAPEATVSTPAETVSTPPAAAAPAADAPVATASTPAETVSAPSDSAIAPPAAAAAPIIAPVVAPDTTVSAPAATAPVHKASPSARTRKPAATPAAAASEAAPAEPVSTPAAHDVVPAAADNQSADNANSPAKPVAVAPKTSTTRSAGMLISIVVVLLIGAGVPVYNRWRRRKLADETRGQNLSFTKEAKSDPGTSDTTGGHKAA